MKTIKSKKELSSIIAEEKKNKKRIGLVPTMGALHEGHLTLVRRAKDITDCIVVSIFVNPRQFNNQQDLATYPRTIENDLLLLEQEGVQYVFLPEDDDIYDDIENERSFDFGMLDKVMEGTQRPGHFEGVAQIVSRLFDIVQPDCAFFGEKDFQQLAIIRKMVKDYDYPVRIIPVPIVREPSGLALSSRNQRLTEEQKTEASQIFKTLKQAKKNKRNGASIPETKDYVVQTLNRVPSLEVEYFAIVDAETLQEVNNWEEASECIGCIACYCGSVRLIDNIFF